MKADNKNGLFLFFFRQSAFFSFDIPEKSAGGIKKGRRF